ncbi:NADP-dependent oxidoreductase [Agrococcus sp. SGAir0287]|uniref:NADP-dependent oxidoreductase n=1 Tax=Agrococcus sp. SGAir0287 TaxID=2070347 RepID=UPI0010CCBCCB|nr:NADP-dependent oxidoreductase [Agrococcus sp. SGAir0287]QCR20260.1 NADPH:quinone reductase [Agrococcus sp. SGAir0287]
MPEDAASARAVVADEPGGPDVLRVAAVPMPEPGIGEVLVRVHAASVNPVDVMQRQHGTFGGGRSIRIGYDVAGVVEEVGPGVTLFAPGDAVFGMLPFPHAAGAYATHVVAPTRALVRTPASLSHAEAAALPLAGLTAWQALVDTARLERGQRVVVTGAAGGVGHLAVQIAHAIGAHVIGVASATDAALVRSLGADEVLDYREQHYADVVRGADVVLDVQGGESAALGVAAVRPGGILVITLPQQMATLAPIAEAAGVRAAALFVEADQVGLAGMVELVESGLLRPIVAATLPLAEAGRAQSERFGPGKVVLLTSDEG